ncbi:hypothetical protein GR927_35920 [Mycolicibacterium sp. 3033]|nr:hypothetical protein [Mycolicibacterium aurantiacum]
MSAELFGDRAFAPVIEPDWPADDPGPPEPPGELASGGTDDGPTTWEPFDLGPYLRGEVHPLSPTVGVYRSDGQQLLYPNLEHAVIAHTAAGKTWFALACVTAELLAGHRVVYLHFEESSPASTVERLLRIGLSADVIAGGLRFVAPSKPARALDDLLAVKPTLVVFDGVNEAMVLHGVKIDLEGWSAVRRRIVEPFKAAGAAVLECDHLPLNADPLRGDAYGTVHKGNVIDGVRFALVRKERFGRRRRGRSLVYSTKDRPGQVEMHGRDSDGTAVFLGTLVVDDTDTTPDFLTLYAPKPATAAEAGECTVDPPDELRTAIVATLAGLTDRRVDSRRRLLTHLRKAGHPARDGLVRDAIDRLVVDGELIEEPGRNRSVGYRLPIDSSASQPSPEIGGS